jgi:hypothetical protein
MKRVVLSSAALLAALVLPGCPVYPEERGCFTREDCRSGEVCSADGDCVSAAGGAGGAGVGGSSSDQCDEPSDCRGNQTCGRDRRCRVGDCTFHGCVSGFECRHVEGDWACARSDGGIGGSAGYGDAAVDSAPTGDAAGSGGTGTDASDGAVPDAGSDAEDDGAPGDSGGDAQTDAPRDAAADARDSATDAPRDSASDAPRG